MGQKGLLFDFDGTLYGDWRLWVRLIQETLSEFQVQVTGLEALEKARSMINNHAFVNISGVAIALAQERGLNNDQDIRSQFFGRIDRAMDETGPGDELVGLLKAFKRDHFRMGIVSFMRKPRLLHRLELWKITGYFDAIVTPEQFPEFKPSPRPFLAAVQQMQLSPLDCFVVGDEPVDMEGGKKAGAKTVGVPRGFFSEEELRKAGADFVIESLALLPEIVGPSSAGDGEGV